MPKRLPTSHGGPALKDLERTTWTSQRLSLSEVGAEEKADAYERSVRLALWMQRQHRNKPGWWKGHNKQTCYFCRTFYRQYHS